MCTKWFFLVFNASHLCFLGDMIYQYNVSYSPEVDNKKVRCAMINGQGEVLGKPRAFDGMVLYMPKKLPETVTKLVTKRKSDDSPVEITITLTNEIPCDSPSCLHIYNVIFRRYVRIVKYCILGKLPNYS